MLTPRPLYEIEIIKYIYILKNVGNGGYEGTRDHVDSAELNRIDCLINYMNEGIPRSLYAPRWSRIESWWAEHWQQHAAICHRRQGHGSEQLGLLVHLLEEHRSMV